MTNQHLEIKSKGWHLDNSYAGLPQVFYSCQNPTPVRAPKLVIFNEALAASLGMDAEALQGESGVAQLAGNQVPEGVEPIAQAYAGHQFGHFTMLGDGRAVLLGEQLTTEGGRWDIQLKGSGRTPYSRGGDGRAALGPMLREYIISEAMAGLGIPTTRSLAVVSTGESVLRENVLPGAILTRVAASHIRVGTFEYAARWAAVEELRALADYTIQRHYPYIADTEERYLIFLQEVVKRQAALIAQWQLVGFIHGVMNTDNMTISGETIDYGPCAFMDNYDPATVFSSIDTYGRYAYGNQPKIAPWNLARFAEALLPLLHSNQEEAVELAQATVSSFAEMYQAHWMDGMRVKLGLFNEELEDGKLFDRLLALMHKHQTDYTNTFLALTFDRKSDNTLFGDAEFTEWQQLWQERLLRQSQDRNAIHQQMKSANPAVIPRNHRVEEALAAAEKDGDLGVLVRLLKVLREPYAHLPEQEEYAAPPPPSSCRYRTFCGT